MGHALFFKYPYKFNFVKLLYFFVSTVLALSGCAALEPTLPSTSTVEPNFGFVSAQSYTSTSRGFGLVIQNIGTSKRYGLTLGADTQPAATFTDKVTAIKVPAGQYKLVNWSSGDPFVHSLQNADSSRNLLMQPFNVTDGSVIVLGRFILDKNVREQYFSTEIKSEIRLGRISTKETQDAFHEQYPMIKESSFLCLSCIQ